MQANIPKPYLKLGKSSVLEHTLSCFIKLPGLHQVIVATSAPYLDHAKNILHRLFPNLNYSVVQGGEERLHSIYNALQKVDSAAEFVAVHDAVRPFVSQESILECLNQAAVSGGAILGIQVKDTIKKIDAQRNIIETPKRSELWQAQTPQIFKRLILIKAYERAMSSNLLATDDASLVEATGTTVTMVRGDHRNFKLTYPLDFKMAEVLIQEQKKITPHEC